MKFPDFYISLHYLQVNISITFITSPPLEDMRGKEIGHRRALQVSESRGRLVCMITSGYLWPWWEKLQVPGLTSPLYIQVPPQLSRLTPCYASSSWLGKNGPEMDLLTIQLPTSSCLVDIKWNWTSLTIRQCAVKSQVLFHPNSAWHPRLSSMWKVHQKVQCLCETWILHSPYSPLLLACLNNRGKSKKSCIKELFAICLIFKWSVVSVKL